MTEALKMQSENRKEIANDKLAEVQNLRRSYDKKEETIQEDVSTNEKTDRAFSGRLLEKYDQTERSRVEKIKTGLSMAVENLGQYEYECKNIKTPNLIKKTTRLLGDKLGIKTKKGEERRDREAMAVAISEYRKELRAERKALKERIEQEENEREAREAEFKAEQERIEKEKLAFDMAEAHKYIDRKKTERLHNQRSQEIVERDLNSRLLSVENLEEEVLSENPEVQKRFIEFEDAQIPVYDLKGLAFSMLSTTVDYRSSCETGCIGTETFRTVLENPAFWAEDRDKAMGSNGFATRNANARGDTISTSYRNSKHNLSSYCRGGELVYGFDNVSADSIILIHNGDGGTDNMAGKGDTDLLNPDIIDKLEGADGTSSYNEILLRRYDETGQAKLPDYIIVENGKISETSLKHAKFFNIPIVNIEKNDYIEKAIKHGEEIINSIDKNGNYIDTEKKIAALISISEYKRYYSQRESIGRSFDEPYLNKFATEKEKICFELSNLEFDKRLEFVKNVLEKTIKETNDATAKGQTAQNFSQFDFFNIYIRDVQNNQSCTEDCDNEDRSYDAPGNCNWIEIDFRLKEAQRNLSTRIYNGENIYKSEEAISNGILTQEDINKSDSSYYRALEPLVRRYFKAIRQNRNLENNL